MVAGEKPVEQSGARATDVKIAGRRRREAYADRSARGFRCFAHRYSLLEVLPVLVAESRIRQCNETAGDGPIRSESSEPICRRVERVASRLLFDVFQPSRANVAKSLPRRRYLLSAIFLATSTPVRLPQQKMMFHNPSALFCVSMTRFAGGARCARRLHTCAHISK